MTFCVPKAYDGKLMREFIRGACGVTHGMLVRLKKIPGGILLNGEPVTVRAVLSERDRVSLMIEDSENDVNPYVSACGEMPEILYEDDAVIVVNKPCGMPTHTSLGHRDDSLANRVCAYYKERGVPFVFRAVNRLDKDTSGAVLIAKNAFYAAKLSAAIAEGGTEKRYFALLCGDVEAEGRIEGYIKREDKSIIKRSFSRSPSEGADYSLTEYVRISAKNGISAVALALKTGRTHQIRVHVASLGAPILGDTLYGKESELIKRQALHAYFLAFPSPINGETVTVRAPLPKDISEAMKAAGLPEPSL